MSESLLNNGKKKETHKYKKTQYIQFLKIIQQEKHLWDQEVDKEFLAWVKKKKKKKAYNHTQKE